MNKLLDTEEEAVCDRCYRDITPEEKRLVVGLEYEGENFIEVYCEECMPFVLPTL